MSRDEDSAPPHRRPPDRVWPHHALGSGMTSAEATTAASPDDGHLWDAITAAAMVTRDTGMTTLVLIPRRPAVVAWARYVAQRFGTPVTVEVTIGAAEIRFRIFQKSDPPELCPMAGQSPLGASGRTPRPMSVVLLSMKRCCSWFIGGLRRGSMIGRGNPCSGHIGVNREHAMGGAQRDE